MAASLRTAVAPLRAATAAAAAAATMSAAPARPRVAVIGAGFAGLAAALELQRSGCCDVTVLEASGRPGGRASTMQLPSGTALEVGATWFHGLGDDSEPNPVFREALEAGLIEANPEAEQWWSSQFLLPGSTQLLSKEQQAAVTHTLAAWGEAVEELPPDAPGTTADHLRRAWDQLLASGKLGPEHLELAQRVWRWREQLQRAMDGCHSTSEQSAQGHALYDEMPGGVNCPLPAGMQAVAEHMAAKVADLRFQHAVQRIEWGSPSSSISADIAAAPSSSGGSARVRIACSNGDSLEADAAIVTVSLGVLQAQHSQLFTPALPAEKAAAIERLRIGCVNKLFLDFGPADGTAGGGGSGNARAAEALTAGSAPAVSYSLLWSGPWEGASKSGSFTAAQPTAAESQLPAWAKGIFSIRFGGPETKRPQLAGSGSTGQPAAASGAVGTAAAAAGSGQEAASEEGEEAQFIVPCPQQQQPRCFQGVAWVSGEAALEMESASDEEVLRTLRHLAALFPQLQLPPGASWDRVRLYRSQWGTDPLFQGSYSYIPAGSSPADVAALAAPICLPDGVAAGVAAGGEAAAGPTAGGAPVLLFAGEACHVKYIGTMHGAAITGQAAAAQLLSAWQGVGRC